MVSWWPSTPAAGTNCRQARQHVCSLAHARRYIFPLADLSIRYLFVSSTLCFARVTVHEHCVDCTNPSRYVLRIFTGRQAYGKWELSSLKSFNDWRRAKAIVTLTPRPLMSSCILKYDDWISHNARFHTVTGKASSLGCLSKQILFAENVARRKSKPCLRSLKMSCTMFYCHSYWW